MYNQDVLTFCLYPWPSLETYTQCSRCDNGMYMHTNETASFPKGHYTVL